MKRLFALAGVVLVATACGAQPSVSTARSAPLATKEWCAEYERILTGAGSATPAEPSATPLANLPEPLSPEILSAMEKLKNLGESAPAEIRDVLRAAWTQPDEALLAGPTGPPPHNWEALLEPQTKALRWINDNCGTPLGESSGPAAVAPDLHPIEPVGGWQAVQQGRVGRSAWTFFRTGATDGGVCVAFEANPSNVDWEARIGAPLPAGTPIPFPPIPAPGLSVPPAAAGGMPGPAVPPPPVPPLGLSLPPAVPPPPVPPPPVPTGIDLDYKGKLPQCGPAPDLFERSDPVIFWVYDQDPTNHYNVLAGLVVGSARSLTVTFEGGDAKVVTPVDGTFGLTYDAKLRIAKVVPDLGADSQVICEPVPDSATPPGAPAFFEMSCQGSVTRSGLPAPSGSPRR